MDRRGIRLEDIVDAESLRKLPPLTKGDIRANFDDLLARDVPSGQLRSGWSGGTAGERLNFRSTRQERFSYAYARWLLTFEWTGARLGDPHVSIRQASARPRSPHERLLYDLSLRLQRLTKIDTMQVTEENLAGLVTAIRRARPKSVFSYPSALALIASYARDRGLACPPIPALCLGGERLLERQRALLREVFGSDPYVRYGSNELHEVAGQCAERAGLHILAGDFILEVVDHEGRPLPPGTRGRLLITSLHNYGMPFIRYENGDTGALMQDVCPCGRGLPLLSPLIGRTSEYLVFTGGRCVEAAELDIGNLLPPRVVQYQLVQEGIDHFVLSVVPAGTDAGYPWDSTVNSVSAALASASNSRPHGELRLVDSIAMNLSGKRLSFVSHLEPHARRTGA